MVATPVFWPGEFHGLYSPWGHKQLDTTEWLSPLPVLRLQFASFTISKSPSVVCTFYPWPLKSHFHPSYSSVAKIILLKTKFSCFFFTSFSFYFLFFFFFLLKLPLPLGLIQPLPTSLFFNFMFLFLFFETEQDPMILTPMSSACLLSVEISVKTY